MGLTPIGTGFQYAPALARQINRQQALHWREPGGYAPEQ